MGSPLTCIYACSSLWLKILRLSAVEVTLRIFSFNSLVNEHLRSREEVFRSQTAGTEWQLTQVAPPCILFHEASFLFGQSCSHWLRNKLAVGNNSSFSPFSLISLPHACWQVSWNLSSDQRRKKTGSDKIRSNRGDYDQGYHKAKFSHHQDIRKERHRGGGDKWFHFHVAEGFSLDCTHGIYFSTLRQTLYSRSLSFSMFTIQKIV